MRPVYNCYTIAALILIACPAAAQLRENGGAATLRNISAPDTSYWQTQVTGVAGVMLHAVSAVDRDICWMGGSGGTILRTTDGGDTWSQVDAGIIDTQTVRVIEGLSAYTAFAATTTSDTTYIYRTTNAGTTWTGVFSQPHGSIAGLKMFNSIDGIAVGDPVDGRWTILKTTNGGGSWFRTGMEPLQIDGASGGYGFGTFDTSEVWFFDSAGRTYTSNDGGQTWFYPSQASGGVWRYWINTPGTRLVVGRGMALRFLDPGGWQIAGMLPEGLTPVSGLVGALWTDEFWLVQSRIYFTPDVGSTWTSAPPHGLNKLTTLLDMVTSGPQISAWAVGAGDTVYHYYRNLTGVDEYTETIPEEFSLSQNYPNPFNPSTTIQYSIPVGTYGPASPAGRSASLRVYDVLGREVSTLVNQAMSPGTHSVTFDASGLASGVYFYRMQAGRFVQTRAMILLK